jgi:hypothetical protein
MSERNPITAVTDAATFEDIWSTPDGQVPLSITNYSGRGEDIVIQRINLEPLFHKLVLINRDKNTRNSGNCPWLSVDANAPSEFTGLPGQTTLRARRSRSMV